MNNFIFKKYVQFIERNGYFPMMFQPYNCSEIFDVSPTITANCGCKTSSAAVLITNLGDEEMNKIRNYSFGNYSPSGHDASRIVDENGVAPTVKENHGTVTAVAREESNKIMIDEVKRIVSATRKCDIGVTVHDNGDIRPHRLDKKKSGISEMQINKDTNISNTVTASHMPKTYGDSTNFRIRKLTPKECWRLMGFDDEDFYKAEAVNSNSQLYKQAGNSIVVDVIEKIYEKLFERYGDVIK